MTVTTQYGVDLTVEIALSAATGTYATWGNDRWGTGLWGPDETWQDVSAWVRGIDTNAAFGREVASWEAGTATVTLDNRDGRFSPSNLAGPYVVGGVTSIRPWRPIRVRVGWGGHTYDVWRGYIKPWTERYSAVAGPGTGDVELTVQCVDEFGSLARFDGLEQTPVGAGESFGRRLHRILDNAGHTGARDIHPGNVTMQATTLSQNAVSELKLAADSEGGAVYVGPDGAIIGEHNYALIENTRSNTVQVTWGDGGGGELPYENVEPEFDGDMLVNIAAYARVGSTAQVVTDESSRALYGPARDVRTDLVCETDAQALALARFRVQQLSQPVLRMSRIDVTPLSPDPALSASLWPTVLRTRVRDLHRVIRRPPGGYVITQDCHVAGIHHTIRLDEWRTTFDLFSATAYQLVGRWGVGTWGVSKWFI